MGLMERLDAEHTGGPGPGPGPGPGSGPGPSPGVRVWVWVWVCGIKWASDWQILAWEPYRVTVYELGDVA